MLFSDSSNVREACHEEAVGSRKSRSSGSYGRLKAGRFDEDEAMPTPNGSASSTLPTSACRRSPAALVVSDVRRLKALEDENRRHQFHLGRLARRRNPPSVGERPAMNLSLRTWLAERAPRRPKNASRR